MRKGIKVYSNLRGGISSIARRVRVPSWARLALVLFGLALICWFLLREPRIDSPQLETLSSIDQIEFRSHWELRLPSFREYFRASASQHKVDWTLLSVIGYQESKWLENAVSPTGVRGIMMLTRRTAKEVGVSDRTDPRQSIAGGAQYLAYLLRKSPADLNAEERVWFAVSAYNGGIGRLRKAYRQWREGASPSSSWRDFEAAMANGSSEPLVRTAIQYTKRVRDYYYLADWIVKTD